jgi:hypothetical protein
MFIYLHHQQQQRQEVSAMVDQGYSSLNTLPHGFEFKPTKIHFKLTYQEEMSTSQLRDRSRRGCRVAKADSMAPWWLELLVFTSLMVDIRDGIHAAATSTTKTTEKGRPRRARVV